MPPKRGTTGTHQDIKSRLPPPNPSGGAKGLFFSLWLFRIGNALSILTFFQPDEYYQCLEPAWQANFGSSSNAWITWEWQEGLRSSLHPIVFSLWYGGAARLGHFMKAAPHIRALMMVMAPKILQAAIAAGMDVMTYRLAGRVYGWGSNAAQAALVLTLVSPWNFFAGVRTFSNSAEACLTVVALQFWPWDWFLEGKGTKKQEKEDEVPDDLFVSLAASAVACILRPTNLLIWITITLALVLRGTSPFKLSQLVQAVLFCGGMVLVVSAAIDYHVYGDWVFPPLKFMYFNVVQSLSVFYGKNRIDYYFTEGLPLLLTTALPFAAVGMYQALRPSDGKSKEENEKKKNEFTIRRILALTVAASVLALTAISHKEVRFLFPFSPILLTLAAGPAAKFFIPPGKDSAIVDASKLKLLLLTLGLAASAGIAYYTSAVHQKGIIEVMHYLRHEYEIHHLRASGPEAEMTVGFLMPCHSTPWRSHFVYPDIKAWALTCEPPLHLPAEQREGYLDEADIFYKDPAAWIEGNMKGGSEVGVGKTTAGGKEFEFGEEGREWPNYLVFFEQLQPLLEMRKVEESNSGRELARYQECWRNFNTHWHDDWRRQGDVVVWCKR